MQIPRQLILDIRPEAPLRFDTFLPGDNLEVSAALYLAAQGTPGDAVLYLWGPVGCGRTHLLQATVAMAQAQGLAAHYLQHNLPADLPSGNSVLAIDDVAGLDADDQVRLFSLINQARAIDVGASNRAGVVVVGEVAPATLPVRDDLRTRLGSGLVFQVRPLNEAQRAAAIRDRAAARGLTLPEDVIRYLLSHGRRDLPSLLAVVDALDTASLSLKRPITVPLLRDVLAA